MAGAQNSPDIGEHMKTYRGFVFALRLIVGGLAAILLLMAFYLV